MTYKRFILVLLVIIAFIMGYFIKNNPASYYIIWGLWAVGVTVGTLWQSDEYFQ